MSYRTTQSGGFTLVELLVTLGIFMVMTGVVLANYRGYNTNALFANASEDIVLALRQAQVYGVGVKGLPAGSCGGLTQFDCSYGVYFQSFTNKIIIYADRNADRTYTSADNPPVETISWGNTIRIESAVVYFGATMTTFFANITFNRPNPDAFINDNFSGRAISGDSATITLRDTTTGKTSVVTITKAGQISLQ